MTKSKYQLIADEIRSKVLNGDYAVGMVIPSEAKLQESHHVSRHTIREAIALLVNEGYLRKAKGSGTYADDRYKKKTSIVQRTKTIGVITTYLSDYIFPSIIRGIEEVLRNQGYSLLLASTNNDLEQEKKCLEQMIVQGVDGLIVEPTKSNQFNPNLAYFLTLKTNHVPVVTINSFYEAIDLPYIVLDDVKAGYLATHYMLTKGKKNLALIVKIDDLQGKLRMKGFIEAFEEANESFDAEYIFPYTTENKLTVVQNVFETVSNKDNKINGVVCYNDEIANKLCQKLMTNNIHVPKDIAIIGQDDAYLSTAGEVPLTTIEHPKEKLGIAAAKWMIEAVETGQNGENIIFEPEIVERKSV